MLQNLNVIDKADIVEESRKLKKKGYRLASITCEKLGEGLEITYHFDLNYVMTNVRIMTEKEDTIDSISPVYTSAFLAENEIQDLYALTFRGLVIDYKGRLYLAEDAPKAPML